MKWLAIGVAFMLGPMVLLAFFVGLMAQAWAPFWYGQQGLRAPLVIDGKDDIGDLPLAPILGPRPIVSDAERYQLARAAGFSFDESLTATAISIAEDGGGDPAALSPKNRNGTFDYGLLQINSIHWQSCGGQQALTDPLTNFRCGYGIYRGSGWCAWSTYDARCGPGHTGSYSQYLPRARAAALP